MKRIISGLQDVDPISVIETGLKQAHKDMENPDAFAERRGNSDFRRVTALPKLDGDSLHEWKNTGPMSIEDLEPQDIDILAWYQPYSDYGPGSWGIYFDEKKMNSYALRIYAVVKSIRPLTSPQLVQQSVWDEVMRHEIEHAVQELTAAALNVSASTMPETSLSVYRKNPQAFEAIATHYMHTDARYRGRRGAPGECEFIRHISASARKPPGYDQWNKIHITSAENGAYGLPPATQVLDVADYIRKCLKEPFSSKFLEIPVYLG